MGVACGWSQDEHATGLEVDPHHVAAEVHRHQAIAHCPALRRRKTTRRQYRSWPARGANRRIQR